VRAGLPDPVEDDEADAVTIDDYLIERPSQTVLVRVRGDSMIDAGIFDGDYVVSRQQSEARKGDVVVAGIPGDEATVKTYNGRKGNKVWLEPANPRLKTMEFDAGDVTIYGKVVTVLRRL